MRLREREHDSVGPDPAAGPAPGAGDLERTRREGQALLAAGDDAIRRSLSGDSRRFLRSSAQQGGQ